MFKMGGGTDCDVTCQYGWLEEEIAKLERSTS